MKDDTAVREPANVDTAAEPVVLTSSERDVDTDDDASLFRNPNGPCRRQGAESSSEQDED